jgi:hypothetical protein
MMGTFLYGYEKNSCKKLEQDDGGMEGLGEGNNELEEYEETSLHRHENGMEREVVGSKPTLDA